MHCLFMGTGCSINSGTRHNTSLFFYKDNDGLLIDCNGVCVQRLTNANIPFEKLQHIFLTHEHLDHIGALISFMHQLWVKACLYPALEDRRTAPLHFYGHATTMKRVQLLFDAALLPEHGYTFPFHFHPLKDDGGTVQAGAFNLQYFSVNHGAMPCYGLALREKGKGLIYSGDTEPMPVIYQQLQAGDILIHECNKIDQPLNAGHTTWDQLKEIIPTLPAVQIYLVHLPLMTKEQEAEFNAMLLNTYQQRIKLAQDGAQISLS